MRHLRRQPLDAVAQAGLDRCQTVADEKAGNGTLDPVAEWKRVRRSQPILDAEATLRRMTGTRERCMYCLDSHGADIEHFRPKTPYPERMFRWPNLLLCCTECGRFKGDRFPMAADGGPLLIDPTSDRPWEHLDFDPDTGNLVARFDPRTRAYSARGDETVRTFRFDRREALAVGYRQTFRRLVEVVRDYLAKDLHDPALLVERLRDADDHGLLFWCFLGSGKSEPPFGELAANHVAEWNACTQAFADD